MSRTARLPRIRFRTAPARGGPAAVLVLPGAPPAEIRRASALAGARAAPPQLVAVDGGLDACRTARMRPALWVGDGDSTAGPPPQGLPQLRYPEDKDVSDLACALAELGRRRVRVVAIAGLVGGRLDHEWANLFELARHARRFAGILAPTARGLVALTATGCRVDTPRGRTFSLLALTGNARVTLVGARWTLADRPLRSGSHGLSNVARGPLHLRVERGVVALILPAV